MGYLARDVTTENASMPSNGVNSQWWRRFLRNTATRGSSAMTVIIRPYINESTVFSGRCDSKWDFVYESIKT